ncbi:MAG: hypothetical protein HYV52_02300 [Parcubacteria group bacterium]|nr:hypothetical protein [Parcubacteria group bacterium]
MSKKSYSKLWGAVQHTPCSKKEEREFGKAKKEFVMCPEGGEVYYDKSWHRGLEDWEHLKEDKKIKFKICPAHQMIKDKKWEGEVIIESIPEKKKNEMITLIRNIGKRAYERDPMDRVIKIEEKRIKEKGKINLRITTTENQLALSLAKEIISAFRDLKFKKKISWSHEEDVVRIILRS